MLDIMDTERGTNVAGGRGYFLKNEGVFLNQAMQSMACCLLNARGHTLLQVRCTQACRSEPHCWVADSVLHEERHDGTLCTARRLPRSTVQGASPLSTALSVVSEATVAKTAW